MYHNWSAIEENVLLGVTEVIGWLVWMGLMSAFQIWCKVLAKRILSLFCWHFLLGSMSAVSQNSCLLWLDFGNSLAQSDEELWRSRKSCLSGWDFLAFLWSKVLKNHGIPKIRVFLGLIFGISLAQSDEESWRSQNSCLSASRNAQISSGG